MPEEADAIFQQCPVQYQALIELHDELNAMLHAQQLRAETVDNKTVVRWLRLLHNIVQDGLESSRLSFPEEQVTG